MDNPLYKSVQEERRRKPRISTRFPVTVRGINSEGKGYQVKTLIDNLSTGGAYLRLGEKIELHSSLHLRIQLSESESIPGPVIEAEGIVLRAEPKADGLTGLAVVFTRHRFGRNKAAVVPANQSRY